MFQQRQDARDIYWYLKRIQLNGRVQPTAGSCQAQPVSFFFQQNVKSSVGNADGASSKLRIVPDRLIVWPTEIIRIASN